MSKQDVGVGKTLADSGPVEWEAVNAIGASFFDAKTGPLGCWDFKKTWTLDRDQAGTAYPRLRDSVARR